MSAIKEKDLLVRATAAIATGILKGTGNLSQEDRGYVAQKVATLKDERLKECVTELLKWGDDERAELETIIAIGIESMKLCTPSKLREAATRVELRSYMSR